MVKHNKQHQSRAFVLSVIWAMVSLGVVIGLFMHVQKNQMQLIQKRVELAGLTDDLNRLDSILRDTKLYSTSIAMINKTFPADYRDVANAIRAIETSASARLVTLSTSIEDKAVKEQSGLGGIVVSMKTESRFVPAYTFLSDISKLPYHTRIATLQFDENGRTVTGLTTFHLFIK